MEQLNEREKTIVDLIGKLAEAASDENTTQEAIDGIMSKIRQTTNDSIKEDMEQINNLPED